MIRSTKTQVEECMSSANQSVRRMLTSPAVNIYSLARGLRCSSQIRAFSTLGRAKLRNSVSENWCLKLLCVSFLAVLLTCSKGYVSRCRSALRLCFLGSPGRTNGCIREDKRKNIVRSRQISSDLIRNRQKKNMDIVRFVQPLEALFVVPYTETSVWWCNRADQSIQQITLPPKK